MSELFEVREVVNESQIAFDKVITVYTKLGNEYFDWTQPNLIQLRENWEEIATFWNIVVDYMTQISERLDTADMMLTDMITAQKAGDSKLAQPAPTAQAV